MLSLSDRFKPWPVIETRLRALAEADLVDRDLQPGVATRRSTQIKQAKELLLERRAVRNTGGRGSRRRPGR